MIFKKIPFLSFEQDRISQKLNLAHAWFKFLKCAFALAKFVGKTISDIAL
jgi:hypothetical protein